jgi:hypothetical protein
MLELISKSEDKKNHFALSCKMILMNIRELMFNFLQY